MANQIGPNDWSEGSLVLNAKSCVECNAASFCYRKNLAVAVLKIDNRDFKMQALLRQPEVHTENMCYCACKRREFTP